jgi:hypothetical protein
MTRRFANAPLLRSSGLSTIPEHHTRDAAGHAAAEFNKAWRLTFGTVLYHPDTASTPV